MKYYCTECNYSYDSALGDSVDDIQAGTNIEQLDYCPACHAEDSFFSVKEEAVYLDENTDNLIELEHFIESKVLEDGTIEIIIANMEHPMEEEHKIVSVTLFDEYGDIIEEKFLEEKKEDLKQTFQDYSVDDYEIQIKCNKHGVFARKFFDNID